MKTRIELETTGNKILNSVRTELYLSMRFMGPALGSLGFKMDLSTLDVDACVAAWPSLEAEQRRALDLSASYVY